MKAFIRGSNCRFTTNTASGNAAAERYTRGVTKVAIIEDQREIREGLCELMESAEGFHCTAVWGSVEEALEALEGIGRELPDGALVEIGLPGVSGSEGIRMIREGHPGIAC